jgi:hypothetical protein
VTSVELTVETSAESDTPVGDSIAATSQQQLNPAGPDDPMLPDDTAVAPAVQA